MHEKMYSDICELKKKILSDFKETVDACGIDSINLTTAGETIDMIKDLAMAEKYVMEAEYYKEVVEAMEAAEHEGGHEDRMGYNARRYASGRYAPKGKGMKMGYRPPYMYDEELEEVMERPMRMGYIDPDDDPMMSHTYNEYKKAKRHYTETKSASDKAKMDEHMTKHMTETMQTIREMWKDADPSMKKKMKADLTGMVGEMPA